MYPESDIWIIGHSLGGALASLLGVTFGAPVVTFEAPGEKMAAGRLHLPTPVSVMLAYRPIPTYGLAIYASRQARISHCGPNSHGYL